MISACSFLSPRWWPKHDLQPLARAKANSVAFHTPRCLGFLRASAVGDLTDGSGNSSRYLLPLAPCPRSFASIMVAGGMAERLKAAVLKTVSGVTHSGVRIPLPPPAIHFVFNMIMVPISLGSSFSLSQEPLCGFLERYRIYLTSFD